MSSIRTDDTSVPPGNKVNLLVPNPDFCFWWTPGLWTERRFRTAEGQRLHFRQILPTVSSVGGLKRIHLTGSFDDSVLTGPRSWDDRFVVADHHGEPPEDAEYHSFVIANTMNEILVVLTTTIARGIPDFQVLHVLGEDLITAVGYSKRYWDGALWDAYEMWKDAPPLEPYDAAIWLFEQCRTEDELFAMEAERVLLEIAG